MAEPRENKEKIKDITSEKFYLTDKIRDTGYWVNGAHKGLDIRIDFERNYKGERISQFASTGKLVNGEFVSDKVDYLTGLNEEQVYQLAIAKVIKIKKDQRHYFLSYLKSIKRVQEEE